MLINILYYDFYYLRADESKKTATTFAEDRILTIFAD